MGFSASSPRRSRRAPRAIAIHYSLTPLGGDSYRYEYQVANDGSLPGAAVVRRSTAK